MRGKTLGNLVRDALDGSVAAKDTIVVLWGDHGWKLGDHSSWCKHTNFECDTRVPLLMRVPGSKRGQSTKGIVELIDLYPTLCELAGLPVPGHCQGVSFARVFDDPAATLRDSAYSSYPHADYKSRPRRNLVGHSVRLGPYR